MSVTDRYVADFKAFAGNGAAGAPPWLKQIREGAIARFAELGFPTTKQEEWRFTSVAPIVETRFSHPASRIPGPGLAEIASLLIGSGPRVVLVDGRYAPELSSAAGHPSGLRIGSLAAAVEHGPTSELAREHLARHAPWHDSAFAALNTAFLADGAFVHVPADVTLEQPLEVLFLSSGRPGADGPSVSHPRSLMVFERGASGAVVETYAGLGDAVYWSNAVTEIVVGEGARAELYRVQREGPQGLQIATTHSRQERDSFLGVHVVTLGAALARHDITTVLAGAGSELILNGLYLLRGAQHADHHTVIDHAQPHCASHEYFNGILEDKSRGVFHGRIYVHPVAQKTDAKQTNKNILLSDAAVVDTKPQLEIYADDVKCTHGATIGQLDEDSVYYVRSRGIGLDSARQMLIHAFAGEIIDRVKCEPVRQELDKLIWERLEQNPHLAEKK